MPRDMSVRCNRSIWLATVSTPGRNRITGFTIHTGTGSFLWADRGDSAETVERERLKLLDKDAQDAGLKRDYGDKFEPD